MKKFLSLIITLLTISTLQARQSVEVNHNWRFFFTDERNATIVNLPHTWNYDALAGVTNYLRATGNYQRYIDMDPSWRGKRIFIHFSGAANITDLMINGHYVGQHRGGTNAFLFEITDHVSFTERNLFWVMVSNAATTDVLPTAGPDNLYGGLFRSVKLIITERDAIEPNLNGGDGVIVESQQVSAERVKGSVKVHLLTDNFRDVEAQVAIIDPQGNMVTEIGAKARNEGGRAIATLPFEFANPTLWEAEANPALYELRVRVLANGVPCDSLTVTTGFRELKYSDGGLTLNGKPFRARGVIIHRDHPQQGVIHTPATIDRDLDMICDMGANTILVNGGTMDDYFYSECDRRGLLVITGIPLTGATTLNQKGFFNTAAFRDNGHRQLEESIHQLYNHPSIMAWNIFSELETREDPTSYIKELNSKAKELDPSRLTTGISNRDGEINFITDLIIWSHTFGWAEGQPQDISIWQEQMHSHPEWSALHSAVAYKCGGDIYDTTEKLERPTITSSSHPERWQTHLHDTYLRSLSADSLLWGSFINTMFEFGSAVAIGGDRRGVDNIGIVTFDRTTCKDAYYIYKAAWNTTDKFVHISDKRWAQRTEPTQEIVVYSNMPAVELMLNGTPLPPVEGVGGRFVWKNVELNGGVNIIEALGSEQSNSPAEENTDIQDDGNQSAELSSEVDGELAGHPLGEQNNINLLAPVGSTLEEKLRDATTITIPMNTGSIL